MILAVLSLICIDVGAVPLRRPFGSNLGQFIGAQPSWAQDPILRQPPNLKSYRINLIPRGGSQEEDSAEDDVTDQEVDDELDALKDDFDHFDVDAIGEDQFSEDNMLDRIVVSFKKTPPLTKGYLAASFLVTLVSFFVNNNNFPTLLMLDWRKILTRGQIWRPFSNFLDFGPLGLGYLITVHFIWTYMSTLERLHHHTPYDFWIMIGFGMISMVVGYPFLGLNVRFLGYNLSTYLVYIWSRYHEGLEVNIVEMFNTRAELLPWFFLAQVSPISILSHPFRCNAEHYCALFLVFRQTFLLEGELPVMDFLGIVFGHVYYHCKTLGILRAPESLVEWYEKSDEAKPIRDQYKDISSDFEMV